MKVNFHQDKSLTDNEVVVEVSANQLSQPVIDLIKTLSNDNYSSKVLPITVDDKTKMIQFKDIIAIEVLKTDLTIVTNSQIFEVKGQLKNMLSKLPIESFAQVSKSAIINLDHLQSIEAGFSGNMVAILSHQVKMGISRKYLSDLKLKLRM